jgi:hypothetical protein
MAAKQIQEAHVATQDQYPNRCDKSPAGAAVLNFLFWGAGYVYVGRMWGLLILIPFCTLCGIGLVVPSDSPSDSEITLGGVIIANMPGVAMAYHAHQIAGRQRPAS